MTHQFQAEEYQQQLSSQCTVEENTYFIDRDLQFKIKKLR